MRLFQGSAAVQERTASLETIRKAIFQVRRSFIVQPRVLHIEILPRSVFYAHSWLFIHPAAALTPSPPLVHYFYSFAWTLFFIFNKNGALPLLIIMRH